MITETFDRRTLAEMEVALERACSLLTAGAQHEARCHIASRIMECAQRGSRTLEALTLAGRAAASELLMANSGERQSGSGAEVSLNVPF